jgi:hypothetical protein
MTQFTTQSVLFAEDFSKPVTVSFDQPDSSSDGGAILLKAIDNHLCLTDRIARCIRDSRQGKPGKPGTLTGFRCDQRETGNLRQGSGCDTADKTGKRPRFYEQRILPRSPRKSG